MLKSRIKSVTKKSNKTFLYRDQGSTQCSMKHQWLKYYNVYINHDPVLTLTYFTTRSTKVANALECGKLLKSHLR